MATRDGEERRLSALILHALARWLRRVLDAVLAAYHRFGVAPDPVAVYSQGPEWERLVDEDILPELVPSQRIGWNEVLPSSSLVSTDSHIQAALAMTRNLLVRIPDEVYNLIFAEISDGVNDGEGIREIAERIQRVLDVTGSERWPNRAQVIAVTEVNRAANAAAYAAGLQAEADEGVPMVKQWLNSHDRRVRPEHREADGQRVPLREPFRVGGSLLMFPGDPTGLPHDVINCRCSILIKEAR
jgi:SPP1 gp7 family putative phage head morphogenesis protein